IEHAGQPRADLRGEADALALAAGERAGGARQREIFKADVDQEAEPVADFFQDSRRDLGLLLVEERRQRLDPFAGAPDRHVGDFAQCRIAPDLSVRSLSITSSGSMCCSTPRPPHFGQAPNGLLNENSRGSTSGMVKPDTGQANFSEKMSRSAVSLRCLLAFAPSTASPSTISAIARPSASLSACSSESARRVPMSGRT